MARHLTSTLAAALVALAAAQARPALAQEPPYGDPNDPIANGAPPPPPDEGGVEVDVDAAPEGTPSFQSFEEGLAPYGEWVTVPNYGRVWRPLHVAAGWRPYYYGRWEWTNEGWLWVSDEPWGWAAYHYGRWGYDPSYGWIWVPGYQWAPAWVTWRYSPDYVGWAPLAPGFSVYVTSYPVQVTWWSFVPCNHFVGYPVYTVAYAPGYAAGIYHRTMPAPPRASMYGAAAPAWGGPARPVIERHVGHPITPVHLQAVASPSALHGPRQAGVVPIYRPEVRPGRAPVASAAPRGWGNQPPRQPGLPANRPYAAPSWRPGGAPTYQQRGQAPSWNSTPPSPARPGYAPQPQPQPQRAAPYAPPSAPRQGYAPAAPVQRGGYAAPQGGGAGHGGGGGGFAPSTGGGHAAGGGSGGGHGGGGHAPSAGPRR